MRGNFISWLYVLEKNLHPDVLIKAADHHLGFTRYFDDLNESTKRFRPYFLSLVGSSKSEKKTILLQLTIVSNTIHNYMVGMTGSWNEYPFSTQVHRIRPTNYRFDF